MLLDKLSPQAREALMAEVWAEARKRASSGTDWQSQVVTREPHDKQRAFIESTAKRKVIRAGRRGGKTVGIAIAAIEAFKSGRRVLYAAPTEDQVATFWFEIKLALNSLCDTGVLYKNETSHVIEVPNTKNRIRAKTAWNADTLRGDYADLLILDEFQLMAEDTWGIVGAPMLIDNQGDAVFIYTPLSLHSKVRTKARDPRHTAKMFKMAEADETGRWAAFHFTSYDNPFPPEGSVDDMMLDMTALAVEQEIMALDKDESPGALWNRTLIESGRVNTMPELARVMVGVDPTGSVGNECGIVVAGIADNGHAYVLDDATLAGSPDTWSQEVIAAYNRHHADRILGEKNFGGDMVEHTIRNAAPGQMVSYENVNASRGKAVRAEPIAAQYERGLVHHVGHFGHLEDEMCSWVPGQGMPSPNRMDALVWALTELMLNNRDISHGHAPDALVGYRG